MAPFSREYWHGISCRRVLGTTATVICILTTIGIVCGCVWIDVPFLGSGYVPIITLRDPPGPTNVEYDVSRWMILVEEDHTLEQLIDTEAPVLFFFFMDYEPNDKIAKQLRRALLRLNLPGFEHLDLPDPKDEKVTREIVAEWITDAQQAAEDPNYSRPHPHVNAMRNAPIILYAVNGRTRQGIRLWHTLWKITGTLFDCTDGTIVIYKHGAWTVWEAPHHNLAKKLRTVLALARTRDR